MPEKVLIFRMLHIDGLEFVLTNGMWSVESGIKDLNFIPIGNQDVINKRRSYNVRVSPPAGKLGEYVPFYFHGHSPMLLNIITGYKGLPKKSQDEIVFLVCDAKEIMQSPLEWCFTDGHAMRSITHYYNNVEDLQKLDWKTIYAKMWNDTEEDNDRQRKKMSEFLVKNHVPVEMIRSIVVHSGGAKEKVEKLLKSLGKDIPVYVDTNNHLYYQNYD